MSENGKGDDDRVQDHEKYGREHERLYGKKRLPHGIPDDPAACEAIMRQQDGCKGCGDTPLGGM